MSVPLLIRFVSYFGSATIQARRIVTLKLDKKVLDKPTKIDL